MVSSSMPKWATPERLEYLHLLFLPYLKEQRGWKVDLITGEFYNPVFEARIKPLVKDWVAADREQANAEWEAEQKRIHSLGEKVLPLRGRFSAVARSIYHDAQPLYYLVGLGMSGVTKHPFAKVRLASSYEVLHIDLGDSLRPLSKNKRHKIIRYGGNFPIESDRRVSALIHSAIMRDRHS